MSSGPARESLPLFKERWTPVLVFDVLVAFISLLDLETRHGQQTELSELCYRSVSVMMTAPRSIGQCATIIGGRRRIRR